MRTNRRHAAVGAIGATLLLFAATTACASESADSGAEPAPETTVETTVDDTEVVSGNAPSTEATGTEATSTEATSEAATTPAADTTGPAAVVVPEVLAFTAPLVGGGTFDGATTAGKPTVFWFWAPT